MQKFDYRSRVSFAVCLTLPASFPRCALASQLIDSKFDQHNTFKSVVRAVFAINPTSDLQPQIRATPESSPALLSPSLNLLFLRPVRTPRLNSNYNRVSPVPKAPIDLCQAPLAKLRTANCPLSLPARHTQPYQLSLSSHTAFQTAIQTCQAAFALILQHQNETKKKWKWKYKTEKKAKEISIMSTYTITQPSALGRSGCMQKGLQNFYNQLPVARPNAMQSHQQVFHISFRFISFFLFFSFFLANILTLIMMRTSLSLRVWLCQVSLGKRFWCVLNWGVFSVPPFPRPPSSPAHQLRVPTWHFFCFSLIQQNYVLCPRRVVYDSCCPTPIIPIAQLQHERDMQYSTYDRDRLRERERKNCSTSEQRAPVMRSETMNET